jgi:LCP family protein required for cell wall assembly
MRTRRAVACVVVMLLVATAACSKKKSDDDIIIGKPSTTAPGATTLPPVPAKPPLAKPNLGRRPIPEPGPAIGLAPATGEPFRPAIPFSTEYDMPSGLLRILIVGADARPGEDVRRTRADSIHLLTINADSQQGTVVGFPRDSWVDIPGRGKDKINNALVYGGPDLLAKTVANLTGAPVDYYVLTGFTGLERMVDTLGGVDVFVRRRMNDRFSGAHFERGWHHFNGAQALAYSRNRNDTEYGDFSRSQHQGDVMIAALAKMRAEVADDGGVRKWIEVLLRHVHLDIPARELPMLGAFARRLDLERLENIVVPGRVGKAGRQSVVLLGSEAQALFDDLRPDGVRGDALPPPTTTTTEPEDPTPTTPEDPSPSTSVPGLIDDTTDTTAPEEE